MTIHTKIRKISLITIVLILLGLVLWLFLIARTVISVSLGNNVASFRLVDTKTGKVVAEKNNNSTIFVPKKVYFLESLDQSGNTTAIKIINRSISPITSINAVTQEAKQENGLLLHRNANFLTPLGAGYIYQNRSSKAIEYVDEQGILDVSAKFNLGDTPRWGANKTEYNAVLDIYKSAKETTIVVTTRNIYFVNSINSIKGTDLIPSENMEFFKSAYDKNTDSVVLLANRVNAIYKYNLSSTKNPLETIKKHNEKDLAVNQISAGGGIVAAWFSGIPSTERSVLGYYGQSRQLNPIFFDIESRKEINSPLSNGIHITQIVISEDGRYIAFKEKYKTTLSVLSIDKKFKKIIPSSDTAIPLWVEDKLYISRSNALWTYTPSEDSFTLLSQTYAPIESMRNIDNGILSKTVNNYYLHSQGVRSEKIKNIITSNSLSGDRYRIDFIVKGELYLYVDDFNGQGESAANETARSLQNDLDIATSKTLTLAPDTSPQIYFKP